MTATITTAASQAFVESVGFHVTFEDFVKENEDCCNAKCPRDRFACSRTKEHAGPHIAVGVDDTFCAAWTVQS